MNKTKEKKATKRTSLQKPLRRDPMVMLICGGMGIGKTYRSKQELKHYMKDNPELGKKGRKVLAFDVNGGDYPEFKTVNPNYIKSLSSIAPRRILPYHKDGTPMGNDDKKEIVSKILRDFKDGMVILDDIDSYMAGAKDQSMIGALVTVRHRGIDLLLSHQSISKITTTEWQACTYLRLHHQVDSVTRYKERIPNYELVRIAQLIINEQYNLSFDSFNYGALSEAEHIKRKSFFIYINMRQLKVTGCSRAAFIRACKRFIDQEESKRIRMYLNETDFDGKPLYKDRNAVIIKLISEYLRYHDSQYISPI